MTAGLAGPQLDVLEGPDVFSSRCAASAFCGALQKCCWLLKTADVISAGAGPRLNSSALVLSM